MRECPIENAISLEPVSDDPDDRRRMPVLNQPCFGCGTREMMCPTAPASIVVDTELALALAGENA